MSDHFVAVIAMTSDLRCVRWLTRHASDSLTADMMSVVRNQYVSVVRVRANLHPARDKIPIEYVNEPRQHLQMVPAPERHGTPPVWTHG